MWYNINMNDNKKLTPEERKQHKYELREERRKAKQAEEEERKRALLREDEKYMKEALKLARKALELGEVPIGAVIVHDRKIIGRGYNKRETDKSTLSHAEITAIKKASKYLGDWRLEDCTIYITLEPCQMCAGAIVQARIPRAVIGSMNPKAGCAGSIINMFDMKEFNHQVELTSDVLHEECSGILKEFFGNLRKRVKV